MKIDLNPVRVKGNKNVFCPYYRKCLDIASMDNWKHWSCKHCASRHDKKPLSNVVLRSQDTGPYYSVPLSINLDSPGSLL